MRIRMPATLPPPEVNETEPYPKDAFSSPKGDKHFFPGSDENPSPTLRERYNIFMNETSFTALTKIHKASSILKKLIWLFLVLACLSWLSVQCYWLLAKYFSYPVDVKIEIVSVPKLEFPSVTVCNRNPLKQKKVTNSPFMDVWQYLEIKEDESMYNKAMERFREEENVMDSYESGENWLETQVTTNITSGNGTSGTNATSTSKSVLEMLEERDFNMWDALDDENTEKEFYEESSDECLAQFAYASVASKISDKDMKRYGHKLKDLMMSCRWNGHPCSPKNFTYVHNVKYGNCFTFNAFDNGMPSLTTIYPGPLMGLVMEFNIEQKEYIPLLAQESGIRVLVHERGTYPFLEDAGFLIAPGYLTSVGIQKTRISRLPAPHGACANSAEYEDLYMKNYKVKYGKRSCMKSCYQDKFLSECGCAVPWYKISKNTKICEYTNTTVAECMYDTLAQLETCDMECPNPCSEFRFDPTISMAKWPSDAYEDYLESRIQKTHVDFMNRETRGDITDSLAKIEVFYSDLTYQNIDSQKGYESQNLISDIGGQLGLWLGLSAITLGEIMEFFGAIGKAITASAVRRKHTSPTETPVEKF